MSGVGRRPLILVVEDEAALSELLEYSLDKAGYATARARDGAQALAQARARSPDLVLLDWMLPGASGLEVCRRLRRDPRLRAAGILMLTARGAPEDRIQGLETGADDYLAKPFAMDELLARIKALLRRTGGGLEAEVIRAGGIEADCARREIRVGERRVSLGPLEFRLLVHLMRRPGRIFSREQLLDAIWGADAPIEPRTVDVCIGRLRKALRRGGAQDAIKTAHGTGYLLEG